MKQKDTWFQWQELFVRRITPFLGFLYRYYFRCRVRGWENVPSGQILLVGNHNGLLTFEVLMFFHAWWKRFGTQRLVLGLAHSLILKHPLFRWCMPRLGAIPADPQVARQAFSRGYSLLVYPGGTRECFRPFFLRKKIQFFQRKGFVQLAQDMQVPIVPLVAVGSYETYWILTNSDLLARWFGVKGRWRVSHFPITLRMLLFLFVFLSRLGLASFGWVWVVISFIFIFIPLPSQMTFYLLPPLFRTQRSTPQDLYDEVVQKMQQKMDEAYQKQ